MATLQWFVRSCIVRSFRVSFVRFVYSFICVFRIVRSFHFVRSFVRVSCVRFLYRPFASCIVRFLHRSCEAFVRFSFVSFAFFVRLGLVRIVNLYDPGSVPHRNNCTQKNGSHDMKQTDFSIIIARNVCVLTSAAMIVYLFVTRSWSAINGTKQPKVHQSPQQWRGR